MYKRSSPEALSLASLGRTDSKITDRTCRGITTAGRPCRNPLKKGSRDKYCHLHKDQQSTYRARLLGAKASATVVEEYNEDDVLSDEREPTSQKNTKKCIPGYPTPSPSPSIPRRVSPRRKPVPSIAFPPEQNERPPSLQLSPPSSLSLPTPPSSIHSPQSIAPPPRQKNCISKMTRAIRKLFSSKPGKSQHNNVKDYTPEFTLSLGPAFRRNDLPLSRYPTQITPCGLPSSPSTPIRRPNAQILPPSPTYTTKSIRSNIPPLQCRPPTEVLALSQSRAVTTGVQRSWETMWVPGIDGLGAHIICKGTLIPSSMLI